MPPSTLRVCSRAMSSGADAERRIRLRGHAVVAAEEREVVDVHRAEVHLQRLEDVLDRHLEHLGARAVDVEEVLAARRC